MGERRIRTADVLGTAVVLVAALVCIRLGLWQLDRLEQRRALNRTVLERRDQPALTTPAALTDTAGALYRTVHLAGRYDAARSIVLPGRSLRGMPGVHLLTPFLLHRDTAVLVNRGWVPAADAASIEPDSFPVQGGTLDGLTLPFPRGSGRAAPVPADTFRRVWYAPGAEALRTQFPYALLPLTVQLLPAGDAAGYPTRLEPPALDEGPHLGYAIQWFSFAAIVLVGWVALVLRRRRGHTPRTAPEPQPWP